MNFDPKRRLVMASFKTVLGHSLPAGTPLVISDEPTARGEVDEAMARRLHTSGVAGYADEARPTPVETPEQERARLAREALIEAPAGTDAELVATDDLTVWLVDDAETGKKAGDRVTNADLLAVAKREGVTVEGDDNKPDLQRKIMAHRAGAFDNTLTNAETPERPEQGDTAPQGSVAPGSRRAPDTGLVGDAHGPAGEGQSDDGV